MFLISYPFSQVLDVGTERNHFQLQLPEGATSRASGKHKLSRQRKDFHSFLAEETKQFVVNELKAKVVLESPSQDKGHHILAKQASQLVLFRLIFLLISPLYSFIVDE